MKRFIDWVFPDPVFEPTPYERLQRAAEDLQLGWQHLVVLNQRLMEGQ
jgi:hypothetical protein